MAFLLIFNHDKKHRKKAMTNYITPNANYDLFGKKFKSEPLLI